MKKLIMIIACVLCMGSLVACSNNQDSMGDTMDEIQHEADELGDEVEHHE